MTSNRTGAPAARRVAFAALAAWSALAAQAQAAEWGGNATLTSDYVWRGSAQTQGDPAVQAGVKVSGASGFYASAWGSNVKFAPGTDADTELDFTLGWSTHVDEDWAVDVNVLRYQYPSASTDLDWTELNAALMYKGIAWASLGYSNEALGYDAGGVYALVGAKFPVNDRLRLEASAAHYFLDDAVVARGGYTHGWLSAVWTVKGPVEARLTAHATDGNAKAIFGDDYAGSRTEAALQASF